MKVTLNYNGTAYCMRRVDLNVMYIHVLNINKSPQDDVDCMHVHNHAYQLLYSKINHHKMT